MNKPFKLKLIRHTFTPQSTIGSLYHGERFICYVLEDTKRAKKIYGETCIPAGTYPIEVTYSPRFKRMMPLLFDVPEFSGVRVHAGNYPKDTEGCLLPGLTASQNAVFSSNKAIKKINNYVKGIIRANQKIELEIVEVDICEF